MAAFGQQFTTSKSFVNSFYNHIYVYVICNFFSLLTTQGSRTLGSTRSSRYGDFCQENVNWWFLLSTRVSSKTGEHAAQVAFSPFPFRVFLLQITA